MDAQARIEEIWGELETLLEGSRYKEARWLADDLVDALEDYLRDS